MYISFLTGLTSEGMNFEGLIRWASERGFGGIEYSVGRPDALQELMGHGPDRIRRLFEQHRLSISALAPMLNLLDLDPGIRAERAAYLKQCIDACATLGVPVLKTYGGSAYGMFFYGVPSSRSHSTNRVEDNLKLFKEVYTPLADYAESRKVRIAFETAPRGGGHGNVAHTPELWDRMFDAVPSPAVGLSFDPSHLVWLFITPVEDVIREYGSRIYNVDGKDAEVIPAMLRKQGIWGNWWWQYRIPGYGSLNWATILAALSSVGFDGAIAVENEDRAFPGLKGCDMARRRLMGLLP